MPEQMGFLLSPNTSLVSRWNSTEGQIHVSSKMHASVPGVNTCSQLCSFQALTSASQTQRQAYVLGRAGVFKWVVLSSQLMIILLVFQTMDDKQSYYLSGISSCAFYVSYSGEDLHKLSLSCLHSVDFLLAFSSWDWFSPCSHKDLKLGTCTKSNCLGLFSFIQLFSTQTYLLVTRKWLYKSWITFSWFRFIYIHLYHSSFIPLKAKDFHQEKSRMNMTLAISETASTNLLTYIYHL